MATDADLERVHAWLQDEDRQGIDGNFLCNWSVIQSHHRDDRVLVYQDHDSQEPGAFLAGGLARDGILQVRHRQRGRGLGRALVEHALRDCAAHGQRILIIQCARRTSVPFWESMGFTMVDGKAPFSGKIAYRVLPLKHTLPPDGKRVSVTIRVFATDRAGDREEEPVASHSPTAVETSDGTIHFGERVFLVECLWPVGSEPLVEIIVDGRPRFLAHAKDASDVGVEPCVNGYHIDRIAGSRLAD